MLWPCLARFDCLASLARIFKQQRSPAQPALESGGARKRKAGEANLTSSLPLPRVCTTPLVRTTTPRHIPLAHVIARMQPCLLQRRFFARGPKDHALVAAKLTIAALEGSGGRPTRKDPT